MYKYIAAFAFPLVGLSHIVLGVLWAMLCCKVEDDSWFFRGVLDVVVKFGLPTILAFAGYVFVAWRNVSGEGTLLVRIIATLVASLAAAAVSLYLVIFGLAMCWGL